MKSIRFNPFIKNILSVSLAVVILFSLDSCARNFSFMTSPVVPAARGHVKVSKDKNNNYVLQIEVLYLAEVERLQDSKQSYVVWLETEQETSKNIGKLKSSTSLFSKQLKATLKTISSTKPVKIFITAEEDAGVQYPNSQIVLSTDRF
jgi:hypothetical protein